MNPLKMQPTFTLDVPGNSYSAIAELRRAIRSPELKDHAQSAAQCVDFKIARADRRFWSPHLSAQLSDTEDGAKLYGRFSPRPEVWTMFMAIYFGTALVIGVAAIYGYVQWTLGASPWALVAIPVGIIVIASLHGASLVGQSLSHDQMDLLRARLDRAMALAFGSEHASGKEEAAAASPIESAAAG